VGEDFELSAGYRLAVTLDSDVDEQENVPDLLKDCTNQEGHYVSGKSAGHNTILADSTGKSNSVLWRFFHITYA
jgi:hypothetical protein